MVCKCNDNSIVNVKIKKTFEDIELPKQADEGSVGFDLRVRLSLTHGGGKDFIVLQPSERVLLNTGLRFEIPEGHYMTIFPRSSAGIKKKLMIQCTAGVIDSSFRAEVMVPLINMGDTPVRIDNNERLVQAIILPYPKVVFEEVEELSQTTRGEGGIGSTGRF